MKIPSRNKLKQELCLYFQKQYLISLQLYAGVVFAKITNFDEWVKRKNRNK